MKTGAVSMVSVLALGLLALGCDSDPVEPRPVEGNYEAVSANDQTLPAFINADGSTQSGRQLTQGSLTLQAPDSLRLILTTRYVDANGNPEAAVSDTFRARYQVEGSTLLLSQMGAYPLLLNEQASIRSGSSVVITVKQPLPPSGGGFGTYPVEIIFRR